MKTNILINALGIQDSGGITVFAKMLQECALDEKYNYYVFVHVNQNIMQLLPMFKADDNFRFIMVENAGILYRLYYENILFRAFIEKQNIALVYNFSGSSQFMIKIPTLIKIQNLMFYSKKLDEAYKRADKQLLWLKQIWSKRIILLPMLKKSQNVEIQSTRVKEVLSDFMRVSGKSFFLKNDFSAATESFSEPKKYDLEKKLTFLYIVGPHFDYPHKNMQDFVKSMRFLKEAGIDLEIKVTLGFDALNSSALWDGSLNGQTVFLGYLKDSSAVRELFKDNTVLVSTSVIETLGLPVIEGVQNGILCIAPDELYSKSVYGDDLLKYKLFSSESLRDVILGLYRLSEREIKEKVRKTQTYIMNNEAGKFNSVVDIFDEVLKKETNV